MPLSGTTWTSAADGVGTAAIISPDAVAVLTRRAVLVGADGVPVGDDDDDDGDRDGVGDAVTVAATLACVAAAVGAVAEEQAAVRADESTDRSSKLHWARKHGPPARPIPAKFGDRHWHARSCWPQPLSWTASA